MPSNVSGLKKLSRTSGTSFTRCSTICPTASISIIANFGISRDITTLKKFEDELDAERNLLRSVIDNLPDYIYVKDLQGRYVIDNISHREFLAVRSVEEVAGKTVFDFFLPELAKKFSHDDELIIASGHPLLNREEPDAMISSSSCENF